MNELYHETAVKLEKLRRDYIELFDATRKLVFAPWWKRGAIEKEIAEMVKRHAESMT